MPSTPRTLPCGSNQRLGQAGSKNIVRLISISHEKTPIGNINQLLTWKTSATANAARRVRRQHSSGTTHRSNSAPSQLSANAVGALVKSPPTSGRSAKCKSQPRTGSARSSQSLFSFARPAKP